MKWHDELNWIVEKTNDSGDWVQHSAELTASRAKVTARAIRLTGVRARIHYLGSTRYVEIQPPPKPRDLSRRPFVRRGAQMRTMRALAFDMWRFIDKVTPPADRTYEFQHLRERLAELKVANE